MGEASGGPEARFATLDQIALLDAMRRTSRLFNIFCQYAGEGAGLQHLWTFYKALPQRGQGGTRCSVWRAYAVFVYEKAGESELARRAATWSDDALVSVFVDMGIDL